MKRIATMTLACALVLGCAGNDMDSAESRAGSSDVEVRAYGALRAIFHDGQTGAIVTLDEILPDPHLYAVGALAGLSGEISIVGGKVYLSFPGDENGARTETRFQSNAGATLLVTAEVSEWQSVTTEAPIPFEGLDDAIAKLAASLGIDLGMRIPFLLEGEFEDLRWHVIDGSRLVDGGASHHDHLAASTQSSLDRASAVLIGFYSVKDQGVFTHMGSRTHVHCVLYDPLASGHVDSVTIPAGTVVKFPAGEERRSD